MSPSTRLLSHVPPFPRDKEEAKQRSPIRGISLPQTVRYALLGGEAREQDRRLSGVSGLRTPDMYKGTFLVLHYSEDITQVLHCPLEEKYFQMHTYSTKTDSTRMRGAIVSHHYGRPIPFCDGAVEVPYILTYARCRLSRSAILSKSMISFGECQTRNTSGNRALPSLHVSSLTAFSDSCIPV